MKRVIAILTALASLQSAAMAQPRSPQETEVLSAMAYSSALGERLKEPGAAIRAYIDADLVDRKPTERIDYTDYRALKRPATLLGQKLLVLVEEYLTTYQGCCVNSGVGAIVGIEADDRRLREFARENRCRISEPDGAYDLRRLNLPVEGRVASISCRERDALKEN